MSDRSKNVTLQDDFTLPPYMGTWYEQMRTKNIKIETEYVQENYYLNPDQTVNVLATQFDDQKNKLTEITGKMTLNGPTGGVKFAWWVPKGNYQVVATDYTNYAVVYSETRFMLFWKFRAAWVMTRDRNPSEELVKKAYNMLMQRVPVLQGVEFHRTTHGTDDKYLPPQVLEEKIKRV